MLGAVAGEMLRADEHAAAARLRSTEVTLATAGRSSGATTISWAIPTCSAAPTQSLGGPLGWFASLANS